jgi:sialic acid synthase SpsE
MVESFTSDETNSSMQHQYVHYLQVFLMHCVVSFKVSVDVLYSLVIPFLKIGSGDANNFALLQHAATKKIPMVVSTGECNNHKEQQQSYVWFIIVSDIFWASTTLFTLLNVNHTNEYNVPVGFSGCNTVQTLGCVPHSITTDTSSPP